MCSLLCDTMLYVGFTTINFALLYGTGIAGLSLFVSKHNHKGIKE